MPVKVRRDSLGRRIPYRDYAAIVKTTKENNGEDFYNRIGTVGGKHRTRGYIGHLKDTDPEKFKEHQRSASTKAHEKNRRERGEN